MSALYVRRPDGTWRTDADGGVVYSPHFREFYSEARKEWSQDQKWPSGHATTPPAPPPAANGPCECDPKPASTLDDDLVTRRDKDPWTIPWAPEEWKAWLLVFEAYRKLSRRDRLRFYQVSAEYEQKSAGGSFTDRELRETEEELLDARARSERREPRANGGKGPERPKIMGKRR